jgi:ribonucleotide reductase alpha subunit
MFNQTTATISQGSSRKGALMISLDIRHKEAEDFINIKAGKNKINKSNLSLEIDNVFMNAVKTYYETGDIITLHERHEYSGHIVEYDIIPINLYKKLIRTSYNWADPSILYTDRFRNYNIMEFVDDYNIETSNPCFSGSMKILTIDGYKTFDGLDGKEIDIINSNGNISKSKIWCSGIKDVVNIKLSNNKNIVCTPDHIFKLKDDSECNAIDLKGKYPKIFFNKNNDQLFVKDVTILEDKVKVYDFIEPKTNWGVVEGIIVHNCGGN